MSPATPVMIVLLALLPPSPSAGAESAAGPAAKEAKTMAFQLKSPAFEPGASIPVRHTCDGEDRSPRLEWTEPPAGTKTLALIVDDPDAPVGDWVHWVVSDLPAGTRSLAEGIPKDGRLKEPAGAVQGKNDFGRLGWGGPCPPPGKPHRYFFKLYALDVALGLEPGATKADVERAIRGHVLAKAEIFGTYARGR
jgi:Raf kinase inhibitor-like YbhB/YbcL family protein